MISSADATGRSSAGHCESCGTAAERGARFCARCGAGLGGTSLDRAGLGRPAEPANKSMACPTCRTELRIADRQGIEIDYCPQCRGVWLDRGELDKIIERSSTAAPPGSDRDDEDDDDDTGRWDAPGRPQSRHPKKSPEKKSFWTELFDFD